MTYYEKSIAKKLGVPFQHLISTRADLTRTDPFKIRPIQIFCPDTYDALQELDDRQRVINGLVSHEILSIKYSYLNMALPEGVDTRMADVVTREFKVRGLNLLYQITDSHHCAPNLRQLLPSCRGPKGYCHDNLLSYQSRERTLDFLCGLSSSDLASLLYVLHLSASGFRDMYLNRYGYNNHEIIGEGEKREYECCFREDVLKRGTGFLQAVVSAENPSEASEITRTWLRYCMNEGLDELDQYEAAHHAESRRCSIQCYAYRMFCKSCNCKTGEGWKNMWDVVSEKFAVKK